MSTKTKVKDVITEAVKTPGPQRPLRRSIDNRIVGGVCSGIAKRFGVEPKIVRTVALILGLVLGIGLAAYIALWITVTRQDENESIIARIESNRHEREILIIVSIAAIAFFIATQAFGPQPLGITVWCLTISALGALFVWRGSSPLEKSDIRELSQSAPVVGAAPGEAWRWFALRAGASLIFIIVGSLLLSNVGWKPGAAADVLVGGTVLIGGFFVLFAPWWIRIVHDLSKERSARIRAQERADMAAHVHDSVLQTLSLIQRSVNNPTEVTRLVRIQERDLRSWLVDPEAFGTPVDAPITLSESAREIGREVEDCYGIRVEVVIVGDCELNENVLALLAAGREATVNAAKWSGVQDISLYLEVNLTCVSMYVRDTGVGFSPTEVAPDRQGISGSIVDRMVRHGGQAIIRSAPGAGTEVELLLPIKKTQS